MSRYATLTKYASETTPSAASLPFSSGSSYVPIQIGAPMPSLIVPPGGFAGFAQQTAATQAMFQRAGRKGGATTQRRRRRSKKKVARAKSSSRRVGTTKRARRGRRAKLVKGSAAAKRYMASIRRKRRK